MYILEGSSYLRLPSSFLIHNGLKKIEEMFNLHKMINFIDEA